MTRANCRRFVALSVLTLVATAAIAIENTAAAQDTPNTPASKAQVTRKSRKRASAGQATKPQGRLPAYYADVVDETQRGAIYQIQEQYAAKIAALKTQLDAMTKERDDKIAAVLTPDQQKKVAAAQAAAKGKRAAASTSDQPQEGPTTPATGP